MAQSPRECSNTLNNALRGGFGQTALSLMFRHHKTTIRGKQLLITSSPSSPPSWSPSRSSCSSPSGRSSSDLRLEKKFRHKTLAHNQKIRHPIDRKKGENPRQKKKKKTRRKGKETNKGERTATTLTCIWDVVYDGVVSSPYHPTPLLALLLSPQTDHLIRYPVEEDGAADVSPRGVARRSIACPGVVFHRCRSVPADHPSPLPPCLPPQV